MEDKIQALKKETKKPRRKKNLEVHYETIIQPDDIPEGARFKGYRDIIIKPHNTRYLLAQYQTQDGKYVTGELPR